MHRRAPLAVFFRFDPIVTVGNCTRVQCFDEIAYLSVPCNSWATYPMCHPVEDREVNELDRIKRTDEMGTTSAWTPERRERQRQSILRTRPWEKSTGPRTREGKAVASQNAKRTPGQIYREFSGLEEKLARLDVERVHGKQETRTDVEREYRTVEKRVVYLEKELLTRRMATNQSRLHDEFGLAEANYDAAWLF